MRKQAVSTLHSFLSKKSISNKRILFAVLNWGLGHATRSIPIIRALIDLGNEVQLLSSGGSLQLLKDEFPELKHHISDEREIRYGSSGLSTRVKLAIQSPRFIRNIPTEEKLVIELHDKEDFDLIISDNRYGCRHSDVHSIFIGHQLHIPAPFANSIIQSVNEKYLSKFQEIWIPDYEGENSLAGKLSAPINIDVEQHYIGPLSRFQRRSVKSESPTFKYIFILSGPEPARSMLEQEILSGDRFDCLDNPCILLRGVPREKELPEAPQTWRVFNHLDTDELAKLIDESEMIVCRSGYSSIMDLHELHRQAILIPTPGQDEQEYLAKRHASLRYLDSEV